MTEKHDPPGDRRVSIAITPVLHVKNVAGHRGFVALEVGVLPYGEDGYAPDTPYTRELLSLGHLLAMPDEPEPPAKRERAKSTTTPPTGERE